MYLLKNIDKYIESIDEKVINKSVYPPVCSGFNDTNPAVREQTVKSMLFLGPKLNEQNLNVDLMKHWGRVGILSSDDVATYSRGDQPLLTSPPPISPNSKPKTTKPPSDATPPSASENSSPASTKKPKPKS